MYIVQLPDPAIPQEVELEFLGLADVKEPGDYGLSILAPADTGDGEICNRPVLAIDPEIKIQATYFTLRSLFVIAKEALQPGAVDVVRRCIEGVTRLGCYKPPVDLSNEIRRVVDPGRG
jgi:hypothetical protein